MKGSAQFTPEEVLNSPLNATEENPFEIAAPPATSRVKQIWAVGGGKGGVGKSLLASSLAICLARTGNKVTAIDLDLGGANLHTTLWCRPTQANSQRLLFPTSKDSGLLRGRKWNSKPGSD